MRTYYIEHEGLAKLLVDATPEVQYRFYKGLQDKFPQLNARTKLADAHGREIELLNPDNVDVMQNAFDYFHPKPGLKARLWRIMGELFNNKKWLNKGRSPMIFRPSKRVVRLERFGMIERYGIAGMGEIRLACGYDALTDTLFVLQ